MEGVSSQIRLEFDGKAYRAGGEEAAALIRMGFGKMEAGSVSLHPLEAAYLIERGKCTAAESGKKGKPISFEKIIAGKKTPSKKPKGEPSPSDQYAIFKAFRQAGHVVRFSTSAPLHWRVYARGVGREQDRPSTLVMVVGEGWSASLKSLLPALQTARLMRLELAVAFVTDGKINAIKLSKLPMEI